MKEEKHSDLFNLIKFLKHVIYSFIALIIVIVVGFLVYISRINRETTTTIDTTGVYNLVDSEGNVIATDLTEEDLNKMASVINGED